MNDLEFVGKIKGMKTLKRMIESKDIVPASQLDRLKAEAEAQEKAFEEPVRSEESHRKTKISTDKVEGCDYWTRERLVESVVKLNSDGGTSN